MLHWFWFINMANWSIPISMVNSHSTSIIAIVYACNMCWSIPSWFCNSGAFCTHFLMARTCQTLLFVVQNGHGRYGSKPWCNVVVFFFSIVNSTCAPYIPMFHCPKPGSKDSEVNHNPTKSVYIYILYIYISIIIHVSTKKSRIPMLMDLDSQCFFRAFSLFWNP